MASPDSLVQDLERQLAATTDRQPTVDLLIALAKDLRDVDAQRALACAQEAHDLAQVDPPYLKGQAASMIRLTDCYIQLGRYDAALAQALDALALVEANQYDDLQAQLRHMLGGIHEYLGDYATAMSYTLQAQDWHKQIGDSAQEIVTLNLLGILHNKLGNYGQELAVYEQALALCQAACNQRLVAIIHNNIATAYFYLGNSARALEHGRQSLAMAQEQGLGMLEATALGTIGEAYLQMADVPQAQTYFQQALALARQIGFTYIEMYMLRSMGKALLTLGQNEEVIILLQEALAIATKSETRAEMFECHFLLAEAYKQGQDFETALRHYEEYHTIKESVYNEEADRRLKNLQVLHNTAKARQEAEIYRLRNVELEQEVSRRQQAEESLRQYAIELERQNAELDAFAHTVAHDLKNMLSTINLYSDMPADMFFSLSPAEQYENLVAMSRSGQRMSSIVDELLLLASVRGRDVELQLVNMGAIVDNALSRLTYQLWDSKAEVVQPERWPMVLTYGPWLEEVWYNYASNALRYGGRPPRVEVGATVLDNGWVRFWVRDNGAGLSAEEQARLFTPFERLHQGWTSGHGLGLSIVRRIVEKLGGRVGVVSEGPGTAGATGCTFYFEMPEAPPQ